MTLAVVFPGQGSQSVGMLNGFMDCSAVREWLLAADTAMGFEFSKCIAEGPESWLAETTHTQPAVFMAGYAAWVAWCAAGGGRPSFAAGHSLGEFTALACAQVAAPTDLLKTVRYRAQVMSEACLPGEGGMVAVLGLSSQKAEALCQNVAEEFPGSCLEVANYNAPLQVVLAGHKAPLLAVCSRAKDFGARRAVWLPVSGPFHCSLQRPASDRLAQILVPLSFSLPQISVVNNVEASIEWGASAIKMALVRQVFSPVRWVDVIRVFREKGVTRVLELGPGKVLSGLIGRIDPEMQVAAVFDQESLSAALSL